MRSWIACALTGMVFLASSLSASVQVIKPIPIYPGGQVKMELNLTDKDFLPTVRAFIGGISSIATANAAKECKASKNAHVKKLIGACDDKSVKELESALSGLKQISVVVYQIPGNVNAEQVNAFYASNMGQGWMQTLRVDDPKSNVRLFTKPGLASVLGWVTSPTGTAVFRSEGKVNLAVITKWIMKSVPMLMDAKESNDKKSETPPAAPQPPTVTSPDQNIKS